MKAWSIRWKIAALVVGLTVGSSMAASAVHGWLSFQALKEEVRTRAAGVASDITFGITTPQELANRDLLALEIRNIMAARPTLQWLDIYARGPNGLSPIASSREPLPSRPPDLVAQALAQGRTVTAAGTAGGSEMWLAAAPVRFGETTAGVVALSISLEGANRLAVTLGQQLLLVLVVSSLTIVTSVTLFMERSINRPIRALLQTMAAVERGDLTAAPQIVRRDEMGQLADGLAHMLRRIRESPRRIPGCSGGSIASTRISNSG